MEKLLLVEDNKTLAKLLARKLESSFDYSVDTAFSLAEAKELVEPSGDYFLAILDLNLPDAPDGEVVDYILEQKIPVIVLTGSMDDNVRKQMHAKPIIDYIVKERIEDVFYIINTIERVAKNRNHKVMVVDDSMVLRNQVKGLLQSQLFNVFAVAHGEEALNMLDEYPDISMVLTDYNMPVMDGLQLTIELRKRYRKDQLSIIALSSADDGGVSARFLKLGANDYIRKPFSKEEFVCRINNTIEALENIQRIGNFANIDVLSGVNNRQYFFKTMEEYMRETTGEPFTVALVDIDNLKAISDRYGHRLSDAIIKAVATRLKAHLKGSDIVAHFGNGEFAVGLKKISSDAAAEVLDTIRADIAANPIALKEGMVLPYTVSGGVNSRAEDSLEEMLGEADMLLYQAKNEGKNRIVSR